MAAHAVRVEVQSLARRAGVEHRRSHQAVPQQTGPVVRSRRKAGLVQQPVLTRRERIVEDYVDAAAAEAAHLIEIAEGVEKGLRPRVATAGCIRGLGDPDRLAGKKAIAD